MVLKSYEMYIFSCSAHKGHFKLTFCLLKSVSYCKTVISNSFLYEEIIDFYCFLWTQNIRHLFFLHKMINHEIIQMSQICAAFDQNIALRERLRDLNVPGQACF